MNSDVQPGEDGEQSSTGGLAVGDILFTLFRHKILIVSSLVLGLIAAGVVRIIKPPNYESTAQVYIPYVVNTTVINTPGMESPVQNSSETVMSTEAEIVKSFNTAMDVATNIGAAKILAKYGGGDDPLAAAGVIAAGITVTPPKNMLLAVTFTHRDRELVQPIADGIIKAYIRKHQEMRLGNNGFFVEKATEAGNKVEQFNTEIKKLTEEAGVPDIRERINALKGEFDDLQRKLLKDKTELAQKRAELGELSSNLTNETVNPLSSETIADYSDLTAQIQEAKRRKRELLLVGNYTTNHPAIIAFDNKLRDFTKLKQSLEAEHPTLKSYINISPTSAGGSNQPPRLDLESSMAYINKMSRTIKSDEDTLDQLKNEALQLKDAETKLSELERLKKAAEDDWTFFRGQVSKANLEGNGSGGLVHIREMQSPTPPKLDNKKMQKFVGAAFGGIFGIGLAIAFLVDMLLDRSIRRPSQIIRGLKMPVVMTIPDANRKEPTLFSSGRRNGNLKLMKPDKQAEASQMGNAIAPWSPDNQLQSYIEGLRERVITHFEVKNMEHAPKLVAVTASMEGAGVTTLASGLAASLSRTGNGTVLLVDMNSGEGVAHSFYKGVPGYGPSEAIDADETGEAENKNLSLAKLQAGQTKRDRLAGMLPPRFNDLSPKLKADAYDYVVFDMTAISPASVTPRLSGHMDLVLFVVESERTKIHTARNAANLMRESRANVMAILNKYYNPVPSWLSHD